MLLQKLFKRTNTGKIQEWEIFVEGNKYWTVHGQQNGQKITSEPTICKGKNIGKVNETSDEEQALSEAKAKVKKQIEQSHYHKNISDIDNKVFVKVMLATTYDKVKNKMTFDGARIQPKLDGIRFVCDEMKSYSRTGKPLLGGLFIYEKMSELFKKYPDLITDGELYNHSYKEKFNELVSMIKKDPSRLNEEQLKRLHKYLQYHIYDIISVDGITSDAPYTTRYNRFWEIIHNEFPELKEYIKYVPSFNCYNHEELNKWYLKFIQDGYEGAIVRYDRGYEQKRSKWLIKVKVFEDKEFEILEILEGKGNRSNMAGKIKVKLDCPINDKDTHFKSGIKGGVDFYKELWENREMLIGKSATIRFFGRNPATNIPRFPVTVNVNREEFE